jgi:hypothetical protein
VQNAPKPNTLPTPDGVGHQRTESTNIGCNQWLSLAKIALKVPIAGRNRSLVANTIMCGEGTNATFKDAHVARVGWECINVVQVSKFNLCIN